MTVLKKLGQDPQRSLALFIKGLGLFVIGVLLVLLGYYTEPLWQVPGLFFLAFGSIVAAWGYVGIFANRLLNMFKNRPGGKY